MSIEEKIRYIVARVLMVERAEASDNARVIDDLYADSLAIVELVLFLEEEFDIDIPDDDIEQGRTVGDVIAYIKDRVGT